MSDYSPMEFFQAAVDDGLRLGFTATCEHRNGKVYVTLAKDGQSETLSLPEEMLDADSDALTEALALPMGAAYKAINDRLEAKPKRKKAKKRGKRRGRSKNARAKKTPTPPAAGALSAVPSAEGAEPATAAPAPITTQE